MHLLQVNSLWANYNTPAHIPLFLPAMTKKAGKKLVVTEPNQVSHGHGWPQSTVRLAAV